MGKEIILGYASSFVGLLHLVSSCRSGVIILESMIDCGSHEISCYPEMVFRGKNADCGLSFKMDFFYAPSLRMMQWSRLENLTINIRAEKISKGLFFGGILIQDYGVNFKNIHLNLTVNQPFENCFRSLAALYLQHPLKVEELLVINLQGEMAAAVRGNNTSTACVGISDGNLIITAKNTWRQTIKDCLIEVSGAAGRFIYENDTLAENDLEYAYVLLSNQAKVFSSNRHIIIEEFPFVFDKSKMRLKIVKKLTLANKVRTGIRWGWLQNIFKLQW